MVEMQACFNFHDSNEKAREEKNGNPITRKLSA